MVKVAYAYNSTVCVLCVCSICSNSFIAGLSTDVWCTWTQWTHHWPAYGTISTTVIQLGDKVLHLGYHSQTNLPVYRNCDEGGDSPVCSAICHIHHCDGAVSRDPWELEGEPAAAVASQTQCNSCCLCLANWWVFLPGTKAFLVYLHRRLGKSVLVYSSLNHAVPVQWRLAP